ncbi:MULTISPECIES: prepilin-type N-terminal cleavage/methylation domain-containing protein [unclassified Lentimonas]|uniref:type IV pilus modification PilV family protein n=1 Tax=unclassified Lentimonas TaxID=2630993 RepID=UPI00138A17D4|nr:MULTISPECIES: prepilin-type N-terminal cleavage/methylation domain-containing protein [unclassified Lentimonas]
MSSSKNQQAGFSLIEVMIAMAIFAIVIVSGMACLKSGLALVENSRHHTRSAQIMQSEIERIRSMPWDEVIALVNESDVSLANEFSETAYDVYTMQRDVSGSGDVRIVTLDVAWVDLGGRPHNRTYISQYTKGGLYDYIQ